MTLWKFYDYNLECQRYGIIAKFTKMLVWKNGHFKVSTTVLTWWYIIVFILEFVPWYIRNINLLRKSILDKWLSTQMIEHNPLFCDRHYSIVTDITDNTFRAAAASRDMYMGSKKLLRTKHIYVVVHYQSTSHIYGNKKVAPWHHRWDSIKMSKITRSWQTLPIIHDITLNPLGG